MFRFLANPFGGVERCNSALRRAWREFIASVRSGPARPDSSHTGLTDWRSQAVEEPAMLPRTKVSLTPSLPAIALINQEFAVFGLKLIAQGYALEGTFWRWHLRGGLSRFRESRRGSGACWSADASIEPLCRYNLGVCPCAPGAAVRHSPTRFDPNCAIARRSTVLKAGPGSCCVFQFQICLG